jgi:hypothetical protein
MTSNRALVDVIIMTEMEVKESIGVINLDVTMMLELVEI